MHACKLLLLLYVSSFVIVQFKAAQGAVVVHSQYMQRLCFKRAKTIDGQSIISQIFVLSQENEMSFGGIAQKYTGQEVIDIGCIIRRTKNVKHVEVFVDCSQCSTSLL